MGGGKVGKCMTHRSPRRWGSQGHKRDNPPPLPQQLQDWGGGILLISPLLGAMEPHPRNTVGVALPDHNLLCFLFILKTKTRKGIMQRKQEQKVNQKQDRKIAPQPETRIKIITKLDTHCNVTSQSNCSAGFPWSSGQMWHSHVALQQQFTGSSIHRCSPLGFPSSLDIPPPGKTPMLLARMGHTSLQPHVQLQENACIFGPEDK